MNVLTQIKNTQRVTKREIDLGLDEKGSWHDRYTHSAYVYAGGLPYQLTEGDILAVFSQYGEIVDVHLVRDGRSKKSKGFAFLAYEDQRSTVLAVDNLSGAKVAGRIIRVEHVDNYRKKRAEVEGVEPPDAVLEGERPGTREEEEEEGAVGVQERKETQTDSVVSGGGPSWRDLVAKREAVLAAEAKKKEGSRRKPHSSQRRGHRRGEEDARRRDGKERPYRKRRSRSASRER